MIRNYFEIDGEKYYTGTVIVVSRMGKQVKATFVGYHEQLQKYVYEINNGKCFVDENSFYENLVSITNVMNNNVQLPTEKTKMDRHIDGLTLGWAWYIFLMALSVLFKDCIGLWIFISIVFFSWRNKKIKTEGTYYEW